MQQHAAGAGAKSASYVRQPRGSGDDSQEAAPTLTSADKRETRGSRGCEGC